MSESLIYKNLTIYRSVMNVLYLGKYNQRFADVTSFIPKEATSVIELCFGDVKIANFCKQTSLQWTGYDINPVFVSNAQTHGFNAIQCDVSKFEEFKKSDVCIIQGSLYHFNEMVEPFLKKILNASDLVIISEPVRNMTQWPWPFSTVASYMTQVSKNKSESFRYNEKTLIEALTLLSTKLNFSIQVMSLGKDMILTLKKSTHVEH